MRAFVTGATGFIGTHLVRRLAQTEHELCCLVRQSSDICELERLCIPVIIGDVTHKDSLYEGMKGRDWVFHLASIYSYWEPSSQTYTEVNVNGTKNVMECALEMGVSKSSTSARLPFTASRLTVLSTRKARSDPFGSASTPVLNMGGTLLPGSFTKSMASPLVTIYPGAALGSGDQKATGRYVGDLVSRGLPATALDDAVLTYVHVRDVVESIIRAAEMENNLGQRYLLGKHQHALEEINKMVSEISSVPLPRLHLPDPLVMVTATLLTAVADMLKVPPIWRMSRDQMRTIKEGYRFDGTKAERELGITYTPIRAALEEAIASYRT